MQQRYYDPAIGRFLSVDPAASTFNSYAYANNNPYKFLDPDGRKNIFASKSAEKLATDTAEKSPIVAEQLKETDASKHNVTIRMATNAEEKSKEKSPQTQSRAEPNNVGADDVNPGPDGSPGPGNSTAIVIYRKAEAVPIYTKSSPQGVAQTVKPGEKLAHELAHAIEQIHGIQSRDVPTRENNAKSVEDRYRAEQGLEGTRLP